MIPSSRIHRNSVYRDPKRYANSILSEDILSDPYPILNGEGTEEDSGPKEIKESWERFEQSKIPNRLSH